MMHSVSQQSFQRNHYVSTRLIEIITRTITTGNNNNNNNNNKPLLVNIGARVFLSSAAAHNNDKNNNNNATTIRNILTPSPRHSTSTSSSSAAAAAAVSFHTTCLQQHNDEQVATRKAVDTPESSSSSSSSSSSNNNNKTKEIPPIKWTTHRLKPEQIEKVDAIFHKILWLDLVETSMLTDSINYKLGVKLTPKQRAALERQLEGSGVGGLLFGSSSSSSGVGDTDAAAAEAKDTGPKNVDLKLTGFDAKSKIKVIKEVRAAIAGLGLKEAKELVEGAPTVIQKDLKPEVAEELKAKLEAVGATVELIILA